MKAIVLTFDRLAPRILGCYGNAWIDTPHFDRLAVEGVVFDCCFGDWFGTRNAESASAECGVRNAESPGETGHAWFTGRYECAHAGKEQRAISALGEILKRAGIEMRLIVEEGANDPPWESASFEDVRIVSGRDGLDVPDDETPFAQLVAAGAACLDDWAKEGVENGLLWLKSRGVPRPWTPPREFAAEYVGLFEDEVDDALEDESGERGGAIPPDLPATAGATTFDDVAADPADESPDSEQADFDDEFNDEDGGDDDEREAELAADLEEEAAEFDLLLDALGRAGEGDPARLTPGDWKLARAVYAGYVSMLDAWLGELREVVAESDEDVLWIITAAEGDALGERVGLPVPSPPLAERVRVRGQSRDAPVVVAPTPPLAEEQVHLPLIVHFPGGEGGSRRQDLVQTVDLAPTLSEFFGVDRDALDFDGHSLLPGIARNEPVPR
ncbi:MAG: sulfatase-like hydrolase/transferase, partial [Planctomycetaceae bacterium]